MSGVNRVIILGRLGRNPEMKYLGNGTALCTFSVATSEEWKDKTSGEKKEKIQWHNIVCWGKLGEICGQYLAKGRQAYIEGQIEYEQVEKDGITKYYTKIKASKVEFIGSKNDSQPSGKPQVPQGNQGGYQQQPAQYQQTQQYAPAATQPPAGLQQPGQAVDDDEEIPF